MDDLIARLTDELGPGAVLTDAHDIAPHGVDWRGLYDHAPLAVLRPADTEAVARAVRLCAAAGVAIVPQGGNTSMVAGAIPSVARAQIVLSLARLNRVRDLDRAGLTMVVEAGVVLLAAQRVAAEVGALLPLSISSEGSAQIGGVIAANAGGNNTLRFGNARDLVLGLEVVLPNGAIWHGLRGLRKDNTGYALRHLFAGSEGTLGVITAAVLKLSPAPRERATCLVGLTSVAQVLDLFARFRDEDDAALYAFEYISGAAMTINLRHLADGRLPLERPAAHYALIELATTRRNAGLHATIEAVLGDALEAGAIEDAVIAASEAQRLAFWALREHVSESQKREGPSVKNDVSVPVGAVPALLERAETMLAARYPGAVMAAFGHIGDGNIHLNVITDADGEAVMADVNAIIADLGGSFSAEHGVGMVKRAAFAQWRDATERGVMRRIKAALDPAAGFNPGKVF